MALNTACWRLYKAMSARPDCSDKDWKELCHLWSSDYRTHITAKRWQAMQTRLARLEQSMIPPTTACIANSSGTIPDHFKIKNEGAFLDIETPEQRLRLNLRRGLAIAGWWDKNLSPLPLLSTLPHGYFDDIQYGMDYYTGHFVLEVPGQHKITDLTTVEPQLAVNKHDLLISADIQTLLGPVTKTIRMMAGKARMEISYLFQWPSCPIGTLRLGHITLNPETFHKRLPVLPNP